MTITMPTVNLTVTVKDNKYLIDGYDEYSFENGIEYVLTAEEDIYVSWNDSSNHQDLIGGANSQVIDLVNITDKNHHKYASDNLIYQSQLCPLYKFENNQIGLKNKHSEDEIIDIDKNIDDNMNDKIVSYNNYYMNSSVEEILNIIPREYMEDEFTSVPLNFNTVDNSMIWEDDNKYIAVILDGNRQTNGYAIQVRTDDNSRIVFENHTVGSLIVKTDLMHFATGSGTKEVRIVTRPNDERKFYINNAERTREDYVCRGMKSAENQAYIMQMFDDWLLSKYPSIYKLLMTYVNSQNIKHESQSYLRNLLEYKDIDLTTDELVKRILRSIFVPFETVLADRRLVYKRLNDFFKNKGNESSYKWLSNVLFEENTEIERFSRFVFELDSADWNERQVFLINEVDIDDFNNSDNRLALGSASNSYSDVATSLIGFSIEGQVSKTIAVVEEVEEVEINNQRFWKISTSVKNGNFLQDEFLSLLNNSNVTIRINTNTVKQHEIGIVGVEIAEAGLGYKKGQEIYSDSTSGMGFEGYISDVGANGEIKSVVVKNSGWFYRDYQNFELFVKNDNLKITIPFDLSLAQTSHRAYNADHVVFNPAENIVSISGDGFDVNGYHIEEAGVSISPIAAIKNVFEYDYVLSTASGINIHSRFNSILEIDLNNPSAVRGLSVYNNNLLIAYDDRYRLISNEEIRNTDPVKKFTDVMYDAAHTGTVSGCLYSKDEILIFDDSPSMYLYEKNTYISKETTESTYKYASVTSTGDVVSKTFYDGTDTWVQQYSESISKNAKIIPQLGRTIKYSYGYKTSRNLLSGPSKLQDSDIYQTFSYGIKLKISTDQYMKTYNETINPAGYKIRGIYETAQGNLNTRQVGAMTIA